MNSLATCGKWLSHCNCKYEGSGSPDLRKLNDLNTYFSIRGEEKCLPSQYHSFEPNEKEMISIKHSTVLWDESPKGRPWFPAATWQGHKPFRCQTVNKGWCKPRGKHPHIFTSVYTLMPGFRCEEKRLKLLILPLGLDPSDLIMVVLFIFWCGLQCEFKYQ